MGKAGSTPTESGSKRCGIRQFIICHLSREMLELKSEDAAT